MGKEKGYWIVTYTDNKGKKQLKTVNSLKELDELSVHLKKVGITDFKVNHRKEK
ncbi:hypothetical protein SEA_STARPLATINUM_42 [Streptomyces phage StarPlatinum]|uniref:Uncharacterized protein n=1 Tax=Streptomyces phage StarPlatinum TaxID=2283265 RepID=A0A345M8G9_9CAUD|nr:hypothetical protein HWB77_gp247 [Streptomyces phage StarPlatinum]AXH66790.1 hypothetical protein SEA_STARPLATINUM_42 [Streptomyces phage StarPlatinum]